MADYFAGDDRSNYERMVAGDLYIADDPRIAAEGRRAVELAADYARAYLEDPDAAREILAGLLGDLGEGAEIKPPLYVDYGSNIAVGEGTFVNYGLTALDVAPITIGRHCQIATHVQLLTPWHPLEPGPRRDGVESASPITLGDNVWLGGGAIVLPGVTIGDNSVVGAGAVVTKDVPANVVVVGNPARIVKHLDAE
ncbi:sugar O-acetyltransferase [Ornithinimicrobium sp. F0845]|uniref:sugar O-acetyltransferase n=1 Tax=Ornithinimicrobium sp. F0845 TaxID=2926412 RepID=UPI001FF28BDF|nr:sugar O-acetyltransferase [Ornithinimicrobium sp. F0845]MCK0111650.1 sugar O-acetyltransferase [Ornithinimicrobium sp. F0845]